MVFIFSILRLILVWNTIRVLRNEQTVTNHLHFQSKSGLYTDIWGFHQFTLCIEYGSPRWSYLRHWTLLTCLYYTSNLFRPLNCVHCTHVDRFWKDKNSECLFGRSIGSFPQGLIFLDWYESIRVLEWSWEYDIWYSLRIPISFQQLNIHSWYRVLISYPLDVSSCSLKSHEYLGAMLLIFDHQEDPRYRGLKKFQATYSSAWVAFSIILIEKRRTPSG